MNWGANFVIGLVAPPVLESIDYGPHIFFAVFCFLAAAFSYFFVSETTGKTLEQMDEVFGENTSEEAEELRREIALQYRSRRVNNVSIKVTWKVATKGVWLDH